MELLSDPSVNFPSKFGTVNYEDPNYNVAMPVFVIHGNHDDPSGEGNLSPIDLLATAGLVNYFGKTASVDDINIVPILLQKSETRLALYGLGGIRDERLHRTFLQKKVKMLRPVQEESWFNMLILHQNRVPHGPTNYIPETFLDDFLDLVVWGHEHESLACDPTECAQRGFMVCQPGSSVATSLCEGEAKRKHAVILEITGTDFRTVPIPLKTVRPFITRDVALREAIPRISPTDSNAINSHLTQTVDELIEEAGIEWRERNPETPFPLPLIRLRVDCALPADEDLSKSYNLINPQRFGQQFIERVANPRDIIHYLRRKGGAGAMAAQRRLKAVTSEVPTTEGTEPAENRHVEDLVSQYLGCQKLDLFPQNEFGDILRTSIEKTDHGLIERFVNDSLSRIIEKSNADTVQDAVRLRGEFDRIKRAREDEWRRLHPTIESVLLNVGQMREVPDDDQEDSDGGENGEESKPKPTATRGRGRGRGAATASTRGTSTRGRGRGKATAPITAPSKRSPIELVSDEDENGVIDEENMEPVVAATRSLVLEPATPTAKKASASAASKATAWPPRRK